MAMKAEMEAKGRKKKSKRKPELQCKRVAYVTGNGFDFSPSLHPFCSILHVHVFVDFYLSIMASSSGIRRSCIRNGCCVLLRHSIETWVRSNEFKHGVALTEPSVKRWQKTSMLIGAAFVNHRFILVGAEWMVSLMLIGFWHESIFTEGWQRRIIYLFTLCWWSAASFWVCKKAGGGGRGREERHNRREGEKKMKIWGWTENSLQLRILARYSEYKVAIEMRMLMLTAALNNKKSKNQKIKSKSRLNWVLLRWCWVNGASHSNSVMTGRKLGLVLKRLACLFVNETASISRRFDCLIGWFWFGAGFTFHWWLDAIVCISGCYLPFDFAIMDVKVAVKSLSLLQRLLLRY